MLDIRELTAEAFAPYGQVIAPLWTGGQGAKTSYDPEASAGEAKLVLGNGEPRLWMCDGTGCLDSFRGGIS